MLLRFRCPAKVNLFLAVGPKDSRNYHPLRTIYQAIDLCDTMTIREGSGRHEVLFSEPEVPVNNTVTKALRLLSEVISLPPLHIEIEKEIPPESGLGGGSSNAAAILRAAQRIAGVEIPFGELKGIAEAIGMDVPFFLVGGRARAEEYGQVVSPLPDQEQEWFVVARPEIGISTPTAYRRLDDLSYEWHEFPATDELYNDFERVASCDSLDLIELMRFLGARDAALSGSGSAVFGRFSNELDAQIAHDALIFKDVPMVWLARSLTRAQSLEIS